MNIDVKFWKFVAREIAPLLCFIISIVVIVAVPKPYSIITAVFIGIISTVFALRSFYDFMRSKYEFYLYTQEKTWNVLKDTK
jgi:hypothetical protein